MRLGFTGTQQGMTKSQLYYVRSWARHPSRDITEAHHGDCIGADEQFHLIMAELIGSDKIQIHPPENPSKRAWCKSPNIWPEKPYLVRNKLIVDNCDLLIATPAGEEEELRSGTWSTVRYARRLGKPIVLIRPSGLMTRDKGRA